MGIRMIYNPATGGYEYLDDSSTAVTPQNQPTQVQQNLANQALYDPTSGRAYDKAYEDAKAQNLLDVGNANQAYTNSVNDLIASQIAPRASAQKQYNTDLRSLMAKMAEQGITNSSNAMYGQGLISDNLLNALGQLDQQKADLTKGFEATRTGALGTAQSALDKAAQADVGFQTDYINNVLPGIASTNALNQYQLGTLPGLNPQQAPTVQGATEANPIGLVSGTGGDNGQQQASMMQNARVGGANGLPGLENGQSPFAQLWAQNPSGTGWSQNDIPYVDESTLTNPDAYNAIRRRLGF